MEMSKKERIKRSALIIIIMIVACFSIMNSRAKRARKNDEKESGHEVEIVGNYNIDLIRIINSENKDNNYLISPYNIEIALNMLREGASGNTKEEIDKVIGNRTINDVSVNNKISVANAIFVKNDYKDNVKKDFVNTLSNKYKSEVLYDNFKTPDVINNWVKEKTNGMIDKVVDKIDKDYVLGLASALALDVKWQNAFECINTYEEDFTKIDNKNIKVEMMHQTFKHSAKYLENDEMKGIVLPYKTDDNKKELEFVAILPNGNIDLYINSLTKEKLDSLFDNPKNASDLLHLNLSLPRFSYSYEVNDFINVLKKLGIKEAFDKDMANFKNMIEIDENVYVGEAVHKTKIELNEEGTKAAAVTYFGMFKATGALEDNYDEINIVFNKPFLYMIRERNTNEILFFGRVMEPNIWNGKTCSNID